MSSNYHLEVNPRYACQDGKKMESGYQRTMDDTLPSGGRRRNKVELETNSLFWKKYAFVETHSDVGIYDRVVIQDLLKEVAQTQQVDASAQKRFKGNRDTTGISHHGN